MENQNETKDNLPASNAINRQLNGHWQSEDGLVKFRLLGGAILGIEGSGDKMECNYELEMTHYGWQILSCLWAHCKLDVHNDDAFSVSWVEKTETKHINYLRRKI